MDDIRDHAPGVAESVTVLDVALNQGIVLFRVLGCPKVTRGEHLLLFDGDGGVGADPLPEDKGDRGVGRGGGSVPWLSSPLSLSVLFQQTPHLVLVHDVSELLTPRSLDSNVGRESRAVHEDDGRLGPTTGLPDERVGRWPERIDTTHGEVGTDHGGTVKGIEGDGEGGVGGQGDHVGGLFGNAVKEQARLSEGGEGNLRGWGWLGGGGS